MDITVYRGLIGEEDLSIGSGTFTRRKSDGTTGTYNKIGLNTLVDNAVSVVAYGAVGDGTTDDREAIQDALDAVYDAGGGTVVIPRGTGDYIVNGHLEIGSNTTLWFMGGSLKLHASSGSFTGFRYTCLTGRVAGGQSDNVTIINPIIDSNDVEACNGIAFSRNTKNLKVYGGYILNCKGKDEVLGSSNGGKALSVQRGAEHVVFDGVTVENCHIVCACEGLGDRTEEAAGNTWGPGEHVTEVVFANITAENCAHAVLLGNVADSESDNFDETHCIVSNFIGRNIGDVRTQWDGSPASTDGGIIWAYNGTNLTVNGMSIGNDNAGGYATVGALLRGRGKYIRINNVQFWGDATALFDFSTPPVTATGSVQSTAVTGKDITVQGVVHKGALTNVVVGEAATTLARIEIRDVYIDQIDLAAIVGANVTAESDCRIDVTLMASDNSLIQRRMGRWTDIYDHANDFGDGNTRTVIIEDNGYSINGIAHTRGASAHSVLGEADLFVDFYRNGTLMQRFRSDSIQFLAVPIRPTSYADATARDAAVTVPVEGMVIYNAGLNKLQLYNGSAWETVTSAV